MVAFKAALFLFCCRSSGGLANSTAKFLSQGIALMFLAHDQAVECGTEVFRQGLYGDLLVFAK